MVKFGRKFFFDNKHSKKRKVLTYIIIAIVGIVLLFGLALLIRAIRKPKPTKPKQIVVRQELDNEVYDYLPSKTSYFKNLVNFDEKDITVSYPEYLPLEPDYESCNEEEIKIIEEIKNGKDEKDYTDPYACVKYRTSTIGSYDVTVNFNDTDYTVVLNVVDTKAPKIVAKNHEIVEGETYKIDDFVESCADNSKKDCIYEYYYNDTKNTAIDYEKFTEAGTYDVSLVAIDTTGNKSAPVDAKLVIKEKPEIKVYTVTFDSDGGSTINSQMINENEKATNPGNPSKSGYTFAGWYVGDAKYDFNTPVTKDITIKARWNKNQDNNNKPATCPYGNLTYDANKYPVVAAFATNGNCAISKSDLSSLTYGNKANMILNNEKAKLKKWNESTSYSGLQHCIYGTDANGKANCDWQNGPQGVLNLSGQGYVGYYIRISVAQIINGTPSEVARYYVNSDGKREFELNLINMPES